MIYRCLLCHGIIRIGAGVRYAKGWCQNCGAEYDFEIVPDGIFRPSYLIVEEIKEYCLNRPIKIVNCHD